MTQGLLSRRQVRPPSRDRRVGLLVFAGLLGALAFGALFPWFPGGPRLEQGSLVDRPIVTPRALSYQSEVLTARERQARADAVHEVFVLDTDVRDQQLARLDQLIAATGRAREDQALSSSAKESAIRAAAGSALSSRAAATFASASDDEWDALAAELRNALARTLTQSIAADEIAAARARAAGYLSSLLSATQVLALQEVLDPLIVPTLVVDEERTRLLREEAVANTPPVQVNYSRGQLVVAAGEQLTPAQVEALDRFDLRRTGLDSRSVIATAIFAALLGLAAGGYVLVARPRSLRGPRRLLLFSLLLLAPTLVAKFTLPLVLPDLARHYVVYGLPLAAAPMAAAVLLDVPTSVLLSALIAATLVFISILLPTVDVGGQAAQLETARLALATLAGSLTGVFVSARADRLQRHLAAGLAAGTAIAAALMLVWWLDTERRLVDLAWIGGAAAIGGLLSALVAVGTFVLLSRPFGIITRVELMELAQLHHPLLRRLQDEAPGTFQHSILVGNMAERAADRIGADPLLVRVGAYYHDIGKLVAPAFFVENVSAGDESPHEGLDPLQSTRVIHQHVSGGVELARKEGLPEAIVRFIPEHHGTRVMTFFYRKAAQDDPQIDEELFRYPGPRPTSRESALVMIADGCEASVRASSDHSPPGIRAMVDEIIEERIDERQFEDCDISLRDLRVVAETYGATLAAVFHPRVEYPEPSERERARRGALAGAPRRTSGDGRQAIARAPAEHESRREASAGAPRPPPHAVEPPGREQPSVPPNRRRRELSEDDT